MVQEAFTDAQCMGLFTRGVLNGPVMLKIGLEICGELAMKTVINPGFQPVFRLPGQLRESKRWLLLRTVNAAIKTWLHGLLARTIDAFTLLLIYHLRFLSKGL